MNDVPTVAGHRRLAVETPRVPALGRPAPAEVPIGIAATGVATVGSHRSRATCDMAVVRRRCDRRRSASLDEVATLVLVGEPCPHTCQILDEVRGGSVEGCLGNTIARVDVGWPIDACRSLAVVELRAVEPGVQDHALRHMHLVAGKRSLVVLAHPHHLVAVGNKVPVSPLEGPPLFRGTANKLAVHHERGETSRLGLRSDARVVWRVGRTLVDISCH